ncbi:gamma-glutamyltransferase [Brevibacterium sp. SMBL_HHYL_HB1]|uniref:gamma-glutamyltransferase n=1 Tax=Brevibacterium sp. SMBL_HHYL_HB1 TaxID=2777556 RepID=UPI001BAE418D|nr:gamma-glutamyltransferase [Brevibacterium sp. SMBL_HHYL_HB1]
MTIESDSVKTHRPPNVSVSEHANALGSVIAPRKTSVQAGMRVLEKGGNAVDAAVAAALVAGVIEPTETTLAGSGFMLVHSPGEEPWSVDFGPKAPLSATSTMFDVDPSASSSAVLGLAPVVDNANVDGALASGVPRTLLGLVAAHERFGTIPLNAVLSPAITAASAGFRADSWFLTSALSDLQRLSRDAMSAEIFLDGAGLPKGHSSGINYGHSFDTATLIRQELLASTLSTVAEKGAATLIDGEIAQGLVATSNEMGGILSMSDLGAAAPEIKPAMTLDYRGHIVAVPPAPGGGITELEILNIWQALDPRKTRSWESGESLRALALTMRHAFADRYHWLGDPAVVPVPTHGLLSAEYGQAVAMEVLKGTDVARWGDGAPWQTFASTPIHDPWPYSGHEDSRPDWRPWSSTTPTSGTTHISAVDSAGTAVAITHTAANHFGNGIVCPRTGLIFDSSMAWFNALPGAANSITPGGRALANMGPALLSRDGTPIAAVGASGGRRIISAVAQIIINLIDGGLSLVDSLSRPRIDASGRSLLVHEGCGEKTSSLTDLGIELVPQSNEPFTMDFARPNVAGFDDSGNPASAITSQHYND